MRIENLTLKGIGPFDDEFTIDAAGLDEIIAITGSNGAGKTFLLECVPGAIYGYFTFRMYKQNESIYDMASKGEQSRLEVVFTIGERRFRIDRIIDIRGTWKGNDFNESSKSQTVIMQEWNGSEWLTVAEKSKAVDEFVEQNVCPKQLFLASCFNSQNSAGDIVDCYQLSVFSSNPSRQFSLQDEFDATQAWLRRRVKKNPNARRIYMEGNHEDRLRRWLWKLAWTPPSWTRWTASCARRCWRQK